MLNMEGKEQILVYDRKFNLPIFRCPSFILQIPLVLLMTFFLFLNIFPYNLMGFLDSLLLFFLPTIITAIILPKLKWYDEEIDTRQSTLLALISLSIITVLISWWNYFGLSIKTSIILAIGVPVSFQYLIFRNAFIPEWNKSIPHSLLQTLIYLPFIQLYYKISIAEIFYLSFVILSGLLPVIALLSFLNKPFVDNFDVTATKLINISLKLMKGKEEGEKELEEVFKNNSLKADIGHVSFSFRTKDENKALFVLPGIHPGPVKGIGGSKLPEILNDKLSSKGEVFTFHGTSTHLLNPIKEDECYDFAEEIKKSLDNIEFLKEGTKYFGHDHGVFVGCQAFNDDLFTTVSFSPHPTEDIDAPIGGIINERADRMGFSGFGLVDSHNCVVKGCSEVYYPSKRYKRIINRIDEIFKEVLTKEKYPVNLGIATKKGYDKTDGIAGEGIKVAVFEIDDQLSAQILIDGNNMVRGLREEIQEDISDLVDISEVHTTDSHEVNTLIRDYNPVGLNMKNREIIDDIRNLVERAKDDIEEVEVGVADGEVKNFEVMGPINSHRLTSVSETLYKFAPFAVILSFLVQALSTSMFIWYL